MRRLFIFFSVFSLPLFSLNSMDLEHFRDLLPEKAFKEQQLLTQVEEAYSFIEYPNTPAETMPQASLEHFTEQQQAHYIECHTLHDLKTQVKKSYLNK